MINLKKELALKAVTKRNAWADTKLPLLVKTLMVFGHFEVHFWSYEGSENGKLKKG